MTDLGSKMFCTFFFYCDFAAVAILGEDICLLAAGRLCSVGGAPLLSRRYWLCWRMVPISIFHMGLKVCKISSKNEV